MSGTIGRENFGNAIAKIFIAGTEVFSFNTSFLNYLDQINYSIQVTLKSGDYLDFALSPDGYDGGDSTKFTANVSAVPLPSSAWLLVSALTGFGFFKRRVHLTK